jgi:osmotically-inducible protein OsmY
VKRFNIRLILPFLVLVLILSGCIPVIIAAVGATAGGAIIYDKRSSAVILQDQDISNQALARLNADPVLKNSGRVAVATFNRVVLMVGQLETEAQKESAYADVKRVPGIRRIYNQVEISPVLTGWDQSGDAWITSKVKTAMLAKPGLSSSQIKVVTENKVVYLMGLVSPRQAQLATEVTRGVSGVRKVVQVFEYEA